MVAGYLAEKELDLSEGMVIYPTMGNEFSALSVGFCTLRHQTPTCPMVCNGGGGQKNGAWVKASGAFKAFCLSLHHGFLCALVPFAMALWERPWPSGLFWVYLSVKKAFWLRVVYKAKDAI